MVIEIQNVLVNFNNVEEVYTEYSKLYVKYVSGHERVFILDDDEAAETLYKFIKSKINNKR
jgi:hypothetical protein